MKKISVIALLLIFFLFSCAPSAPAPIISPIPPTVISTNTASPTSTPDPIYQAQQAALLYSQDFESGNVDGLYDWGQGEWSIVPDSNGNHIYCNKVSTDYPEFHFGAGTWSDYAVELQVKPVEIHAGSTTDLHMRFDPHAYLSFDGVMKLQDNSIYLAYNDPYQEFGDRNLDRKSVV